MTQATITLTVSVAWWVKPYLRAVALWAGITRRAPDMERVKRTMQHGVKVLHKP